MSDTHLSESELERLEALIAAASPAPWQSSIEGRDHDSGDNVILVGHPREEDMYILRDSGPACAADFDFIAAARNYLPRLVTELRELRSES